MAPAQGTLDILVSENHINAQVADQIQKEATSKGRTTEDILLEKGLVNEEIVMQARAKALGIPFVDLGQHGVVPEALSFIPEAVARRYQAIPFDINRQTGEISLAMADPTNIEVISFLEKKSQKQIKAFLATPGDILKAIDEQYAQSLAEEVSQAVEQSSPTIKTVEASSLGEVIRDAPIAKIVSTILEYAIRSRASDVHIEPLEHKTRVRYRIDGILMEKLVLPKGVQDAVVSRIKILAGMKIDEKRVPQDGRFNFKIGTEEVDLRISSLPTVHGEKIVMRLLKKTGGIPTMEELGLRGTALRILENNILRPHGIILVTGPTGSGKTTTLYAVLSKLNTIKVNIVTLEDPVEYEIPGINQVQVNPAAGLTFATGLRSFLRQDPNVVLVGEIRDSETTSLAIQASLTGHLVFSTLHTSNASTAIPRLIDLKGEPFLVASTLTCVVAQRIVRKICPSCKESFVPPQEIFNEAKALLGPLFPQNAQNSLYKGRGCQECAATGYLGRIGIFEVLPVSDRIARLILESTTAGDIEKQAVSEGMITMKQDGYLKALEGITTIEEVLRVAQD